jgi:hypothetical protein
MIIIIYDLHGFFGSGIKRGLVCDLMSEVSARRLWNPVRLITHLFGY